MDYQRRVFSTLFPTPWHQHTTPTPVSTPDLGHSARGSSFSGPSNTNVPSENRAVKRNAAWSTATRFLSLPRDTAFDLPRVHKNREIEAALQYLLAGEGKSQGAHEQSLIDWYTNEARIHFATLVRPVVESLWEEVNSPKTSHAFRFSHKFQEIPLSSCWKVLEETQRSLEQVQNIYLQPFNGHLLPILIHSAQSSASEYLANSFNCPISRKAAKTSRLTAFSSTVQCFSTSCASLSTAVGIERAERVIGNQLLEAPSKIPTIC